MPQRRIRRAIARGYLLTAKVLEKVRGPQPPSPGPSAWQPPAATDLAGQVVVITGATRGIGLELARAFADAGCRVVLNGRNPKAVAAAVSKINSGEGRVLPLAADVSRPEGSQRLIDAAVERFGTVDVLINNAGTTDPPNKRIWDLEPNEWQRVIDTNLTAPFLTSRAAIKIAHASGRPLRIINVSSGIVGHGAPMLGAYGSSKMGLEGLTQGICADASAANGGVSVVSIKPRSVRSRLTQQYFDAASYALFEEPNAVVPMFLYAATAPLGEIMGRSFSEPHFAADPVGERVLNNHLSAAPPLRIVPDTYNPDVPKPNIENTAEYMHLMENACGPYPAVVADLKDRMSGRQAFRYPDPSQIDLKTALADRLGIPKEGIVLGSGSSDLILKAFSLFSAPPATLLTTKPTWSMVVGMLLQLAIPFFQVPFLGSMAGKDIRHDLNGLLAAITPSTRLIYLVNPCNPTGSLLSATALRSFIEALPSHVTLLLDEAYSEYVDRDRHATYADIVHHHSSPARVIALRTFSKFYALAGFRVGYAYGRPEAVQLLDRAVPMFNVTQVSLFAAHTALADDAAQAAVYKNNDEERRRISAELDRTNIENMPTQTSFILYNCPLDPNMMREQLWGHGVYLPNVQQFLQNYAVFPVGLPEHNQKILDFLSKY